MGYDNLLLTAILLNDSSNNLPPLSLIIHPLFPQPPCGGHSTTSIPCHLLFSTSLLTISLPFHSFSLSSAPLDPYGGHSTLTILCHLLLSTSPLMIPPNPNPPFHSFSLFQQHLWIHMVVIPRSK